MSRENIEMQISNEAIADRAYQIWQERGCREGDGTENWDAAKQQLLSEAESAPRRGPLLRMFARLRNRAAL